jgi:hypothetical protein
MIPLHMPKSPQLEMHVPKWEILIWPAVFSTLVAILARCVWELFYGQESKKSIMLQLPKMLASHRDLVLHNSYNFKADSVGFGDKIYHDFVKNPEQGADLCKYHVLDIPDKLLPFQKWSDKVDKVPY